MFKGIEWTVFSKLIRVLWLYVPGSPTIVLFPLMSFLTSSLAVLYCVSWNFPNNSYSFLKNFSRYLIGVRAQQNNMGIYCIV
jgi:hypothetical protein